MARKQDFLKKVMENRDLRQLLFGLTAMYLLVFWVVPFLLSLLASLTGFKL